MSEGLKRVIKLYWKKYTNEQQQRKDLYRNRKVDCVCATANCNNPLTMYTIN